MPLKKQLIVVGILLILLGIIFHPVIFQGKVFGSPDALSPKASSIILKETQEETGENPLWQPWIFSGMPTAEAFTNISNLYFPNYIFQPLHIPPMFIYLLHFLFAGIGVFVLLRYLKISLAPAIMSAAGFMLMPFMVTMIVFGHGSQIMTAAYIPWAFWATLKLLDKRRLIDIGVLAIILGLQLQRSHVQIAYYTWMLVGALALYQLILSLKNDELRPAMLKGSGLFVIAAFLAIGIALLVYLPALSYSSESIRSTGQAGSASYEYATSWSFHPKEMLTFLIPAAYGFGGQTYWGKMIFTDYPNYMGIILLILAVFAIAKRRDKLMWFLAGTSVLALLISYGKHFSIIYNIFYEFAPYFDKFRVPVMILIILQFNVVILAAFGLEELLKITGKTIPKWFWWSAGIIALFALILFIGGSWLQTVIAGGFTPPRTQDTRVIQAINSLRWDLWYQDARTMVILIAGFLGLSWFLVKDKINKYLFVGLIGLFAIIDLGIVDNKIVQPKPSSGRASRLISESAVSRYFQQDEVISFLSYQEGKFRIYPIGGLFGESRFQAFGIESVGGYHPAKLGNYSQFLLKTNNIGTLPLMRMMNVKYIVSPQAINHPELELVFNGKMRTEAGDIPMWVYAISNPLLRAWFVDKIEVVGEDELWQKLVSDKFNPAETAYITDAQNISVGTGGTIEWYESSIHHLKINTTSSESGFLVLSEVHYPLRWKATVDGEPVETHEVNGVIRGVVVPSGEHTIEFIYDKSVFRTGIVISLISFILALSLIGFGYLKIRQSK